MAFAGDASAVRRELEVREGSRGTQAFVAGGPAVNWPEVRLSRDGEWVLCVSVPCGERLAMRFEDAAGNFWPWLKTGWVRSDPPGLSVWRMSKRARERYLRGKAPTYRQTPSEREFLSDPTIRSRYAHRPRNRMVVLEPLPTLIVCPRCDRTQLVRADVFPVSERRAKVRPTEPGMRSG
jgi:hypothetical protein